MLGRAMMRECRKGVVRIPGNAVMLYNYGDECSSLTGGWAITKENGDTARKNASDITITITTPQTMNYAALATANSIDLTNYSRFCALASSAVTKRNVSYSAITVSSSQACWPYNDSYLVVKQETREISSFFENVIISLDISSITDSYYLGFFCYADYRQSGVVTFKAAWLER